MERPDAAPMTLAAVALPLRDDDAVPRRAWIRLASWPLYAAFGSIFVYSGLQKIARPHDFLADVYAYELVGPAMGMMVAIVLPWFELLSGLGIVTGWLRRASLLAATLMGILFVGVQTSAVWRGLSINCGCFGTDTTHMIGKLTLARTTAIFLVALGLWLWQMSVERRASARAFDVSMAD